MKNLQQAWSSGGPACSFGGRIGDMQGASYVSDGAAGPAFQVWSGGIPFFRNTDGMTTLSVQTSHGRRQRVAPTCHHAVFC